MNKNSRLFAERSAGSLPLIKVHLNRAELLGLDEISRPWFNLLNKYLGVVRSPPGGAGRILSYYFGNAWFWPSENVAIHNWWFCVEFPV